MVSHRSKVALAALGGAALIAVPVIAQRKADSGPVARYDMRAGTLSGFAAMGGGMGGGMGMMFGGGGGDKLQHELYLRLGSSQTPAKGGPKADHFMPPNAKLGKSVALVTPREEREPEGFPEGQKPKGRLLVFWGCGEHAPKGQPVIIDFAKLAAGQVPPGLLRSTGSHAFDVSGRLQMLGLQQIFHDVVTGLVHIGVDAVGRQVPGFDSETHADIATDLPKPHRLSLKT